MQRFS